MRSFRQFAGWLLALVLAALLLHVNLHPLPHPTPGEVKFFDPPGQHLVFSVLAAKTGIDLFEPAGRVVAGLLELLSAVLVLIPFARRAGAALSCLVSGTGLLLHLSPFLGREIILPDGSSDGGMHFLGGVIVFALSLLLLVTHPAPRRPVAGRLRL